jgi:rod shape-determining protein MreD
MNRLRTALVVAVIFVLHITLFAHLRPFGVAPDIMILGAVLGGTMGGPNFGARHGFICGLLVDLMAPGPFGLAAGVYGAIGHGTGVFSQTIDSQDPRVGPLTAAFGSFLGVIGYGAGLAVLGAEQYMDWGLVRLAIVVALVNVILSLPLQQAYAWISAGSSTYSRANSAQSVVN